MGDGRYYTLDQFFTIVILTFLVVFATASLWLSFYKNSDKKSDWSLIAVLLVIDVYTILKFIEELYMFEDICMRLRSAQLILILLNYMLLLFYLTSRFKTKGSKKTALLIIGMISLFSIFTYYGIKADGSLFLHQYSFFKATYTSLYTYMLSATIIIYVIRIVWIYTKARRNKESSKVRLLLSLIIIMYICPLVIYIIMIALKSAYLKVIEITIAFLSCVTINLILNSNVSYGLTPFTFDKIKSVMDDYVFVTDANGKIVFKNENILRVDVFNDNKYLKTDSLNQIFNYNAISVNKGKENSYIKQVKTEKSLYFSYRCKDLIDNKKVIGKIITFVDITQLIVLLDELKEQEKKTMETNKRLLEYKEVVYYLEKENEINTLLEEITSVQEKSMFEIMGRIDNCALKIGDESFEKELQDIILLTNKNLEEVRKAVTAYREYYGGNR